MSDDVTPEEADPSSASPEHTEHTQAHAEATEARAVVTASELASKVVQSAEVVESAAAGRAVDAELQVLALTEQVTALSTVLGTVGSALATEQTWRRRFFGAFITGTLIGFALLSTLVWLALGNRDISQDTRQTNEATADCVEPEGDCFKAARARDADLIRTVDQNTRCVVQDTINDLINQSPDAAEQGVQPIDVTPGFDCNRDSRVDN